jgi:hypothetical protein
MQDFFIAQVCPDDNYFLWQNDLWITNLLEVGYTQEIHSIIFKPYDRKEWNPKFLDLQEKFNNNSNVKFFFYEGSKELFDKINQINYIPLLRPYCLKLHFEKYPELSKKAMIYLDTDVLFTKYLDFSKFLDDDICYLSNTTDYLGFNYLEDKINDALVDKQEELRKIDPIETISNKLGITKQIIKDNQNSTGGAQSILKNIDSQFWQDVYNNCIEIKSYFSHINQEYFSGRNSGEKENNGWQSWALGDMLGLLAAIWKRGKRTRTPKELDFAWATDPIERLKEVYIYHNAGVSSQVMELNGERIRMFYKGNYSNNDRTPKDDIEYLKVVDNRYANYFYAQKLIELYNK